MPWGLKSCSGGSAGHSPVSCRLASNSATRPGVPPVWEPICVTRNPPSFNGRKSSVMLERVPLVENMNLGRRGSDTSKKKMLFCPRSRASSPPQARTFLSADRWQWCGSFPEPPGPGTGTVPMTLPIAGRVFVEVDDGKEVGCDSGLVACPDLQRPFFSGVVVVLSGELRSGENGNQHGQRPDPASPPRGL